MENNLRTFIIFLLLVALFFSTSAQKVRNVWCFGTNAELDFSTGVPVSVANCAINTNEGSASIADKSTGKLLFYSDGISVYNRNNAVMPADTIPLGGNISTSQSAYILPKPGSNHEYYLFCTDAQAGQPMGDEGDGGTQYTIIDMNLDDGLGDIAQQPVPLLTPTCEKIAGFAMPNNQGYWVVVHLWNSDAFYSYPLTDAGIGAPVVSHAGIVHADTNSVEANAATIGYMRISPDGTKIAVAIDHILHTIQVLNFDNNSGVVSGMLFSDSSIIGDGDADEGPYGLCFSPGGKYLYVTAETNLNVYQYNLLAGSESAILASRAIIETESAGNLPFALQTGPDSKIYVAIADMDYIDCINFPDSLGPACGYQANAVFLGGNYCALGLPEFPPDSVKRCNLASPAITADKSIICSSDSVQICAPLGYTHYKWDFGDTDNCVEIKQAGDYFVTVTDTSGCLAISNHITISEYPSQPVSANLLHDTLHAYNAVSYQWYLNDTLIPGATDSILPVKQSGTYAVQITDSNGCAALSSGQFVNLTDIYNLQQTLSLKIYPDPAADELNISYILNESTTLQITLTDLTGRLIQSVLNEKEGSGTYLQKVNIAALASGVYMMNFVGEKGSAVLRFEKE